ncbi:MAG: RluA family pseudouridine synthase [Candidatus Omnitrophica bacterium]|nr:RluA family pseudouridine synthase [Candidatus Omnitrophota bacterium]MCM8777286.1 RluA family pseudouridine synthase [Candidatus Omnitrophota bacterium]
MDRKLIYQENKKGRIDIYLKTTLKISREKVKLLLKDGLVLIQNKQVEPSYLLKNGDEILIKKGEFLYETSQNNILPERYQLDIIYYDNDIIVINKPAGILTHPTGKVKSGTMINFLLNFTSLSDTGNPSRPGVVHRLDRETSGVMVFARTYSAWENLVLQFKNRMIEKEYLAIVKGKFYPLRKEIEFTVSHSRKNHTKMEVHYLKGKKTVNIIEVVKYIDDLTLVKVKPITGRTHQIRLALTYSGYPVIGDTKYGVMSELISRVALHSYRISFLHPFTKQKCEFIAPVPDDFLKITGKIDKNI